MIYALILLGGLLLLSGAVKDFLKTIHLLRNGARSKARVVELVPSRDKNGTKYTPIFEYVTAGNQTRRYVYEISSRPAGWEIGEEAYVLYDPAQTGQEKLIGYWGLFGTAIILTGVASAMIIVGGGYFLYVNGMKNLTGGA
jgi:hypothetical protein